MDYNSILKDYEKIKKVAELNITQDDLEAASHYLQCAGKLAWNTCICFSDPTIEDMIKEISSKIFPTQRYIEINKNCKSILFIDTFCFDVRGLGYIYIDALLNLGYKLTYAYAKSGESRLEHTIKYLKNQGNVEIVCIDNSTIIRGVLSLNSIIESAKTEKVLVNCGDCDIIPCLALFNIVNVKSYRINYGDHTFNLGTSIYDYSIEYRDVGVYISNNYREYGKDQIIKLPFYPNELPDVKFLGLPFKLDGKKLVVSGGRIYKTIDDDNTFYKIVEQMLQRNENVIFLMLSNETTSELDALLNKYHDRVYWICERKDLNEILKRCTLYLSTYPILGGLMFQYAVKNGKLPLTLMNDITMQGGFLLNETVLGVEFESADELLDEIEHLLEDDNYRASKESLLKNQIISHSDFIFNLDLILSSKGTGLPIIESPITLKQAQNHLKGNLNGEMCFLSYLGAYPSVEYKYMLRLFPMNAILGLYYKIKEKIKLRFSRHDFSVF